MIFFGDIASPDELTTKNLQSFFIENQKIFEGKRLIYNFEGVISDTHLLKSNNALLFNYVTVPDVLRRDLPPIFCMANNHILDNPKDFDNTIKILNEKNISFIGAGKSKEEANTSISFYENGRQIILFNACWNFLLYNHNNPEKGIHIAEINEALLLNEVKFLAEKNPMAAIVIFLHWNLDQEILPFPMHRIFARDLIDVGANVVVGSHSHCVQGGEKYKNGYIVYGLGNFFIPHNVFIQGRLKYPEFTKMQLILEWNSLTERAICHWVQYSKNENGHKLIYKGSDCFEESDILSAYSPYQNITDKEYLKYFRKWRRKKFFIPVYVDYKRIKFNKILTLYLKNRARIAHLLARLKIINWQN